MASKKCLTLFGGSKMKAVIALLMLTLSTVAANAELSCENDRICGDGQKCIDGFCKEVSALHNSGSAVHHGNASKLPDSSGAAIPEGRQQKPR
jgi:hypothetical protein